MSEKNKNNPKTILGWCMYDWSASVYNLTITSSVFPIYFNAVVRNDLGGDVVNFLGFQIKNSALYSYSLAFVFLFVACINPFLASIADFSGKKKLFFKLFAFIGAAACAGLFFFTSNTILLGISMFVLAGIGFYGSWVFYNSYLPDIATEDKFDAISAKGFALGYIGSVLLLIVNLAMIMMPQFFGGIDSGLASRLSFLSVGVWWFLFSMFTFYYLPNQKSLKNREKDWILNGLKELKKVFGQVKKNLKMKQFLLAFFLYNFGVQTFMYVSTFFAEKELHLPTQTLIITVLLLQLIAIPGALFSSWLSSKKGNLFSLMILVLVWVLIAIGGYLVSSENQFYVLAIMVGWVMGGIQSLSRSTFAKFIPKDSPDSASFFSFYEMIDKLSMVAGLVVYGFCDSVLCSARISVGIIGIFFVLSFLKLYTLKKLEKR
ncbi:MAG: MFS transporter [Bacteroidetes bacterium]|nr:MAG: MFS transporter [Bacteroidota bacterium]